MLSLKSKAKIYRLFGIYLAYKEEAEYLQSKEFWDRFNKMKADDPSDSDEFIQGYLIGCWQSMGDVSFTRPYTKYMLKEGIFNKITHWMLCFFQELIR